MGDAVEGGRLAELHRDHVVIARGEGIHVFDDEGNRYIEALSGLFCASLGFSQEPFAPGDGPGPESPDH